jgi:dihydropteroate synthase
VSIGNPSVRLGPRRYDLTRRCLVMGILNHTPDSFYDQGATCALDLTLQRAEALVAEGADILDVGDVQAGPGPAVSEEEELDRVIPAVEDLVARFDVPVSAHTWNARVLAAACAAGAVVGNDISGFGDPDYLTTAARFGASVVATHIRLAPRVRDPESQYEDLVSDVAAFLVDRAERARAAGLEADQIVLDAGLDLGKTAAQSAVLLRESDRLASLGYPLLLSASNKTFLGVFGDLAADARRAPSLAAVVYGVSRGCRIVRVHDVAGTVRVVRVIEQILDAGAAAEAEAGA